MQLVHIKCNMKVILALLKSTLAIILSYQTVKSNSNNSTNDFIINDFITDNMQLLPLHDFLHLTCNGEP